MQRVVPYENCFTGRRRISCPPFAKCLTLFVHFVCFLATLLSSINFVFRSSEFHTKYYFLRSLLRLASMPLFALFLILAACARRRRNSGWQTQLCVWKNTRLRRMYNGSYNLRTNQLENKRDPKVTHRHSVVMRTVRHIFRNLSIVEQARRRNYWTKIFAGRYQVYP